ncbi:MAG: hypothetical protein R2845_07440 [Thermomicrobiales bacterium]
MGTLLNAEETAENSEFVWQRVGLRRYEDEDAAETRFAEMLDLANDEGFEAFDLVDVDFGDESFSYDAIWSESYPYHESYVYARYGEIILIFGFEAPVPTRDALDSIIDAQIDCFEDGDCLDRIPLTREVIALIDGDVVVDDATVEPDEDDSDDQDGETESVKRATSRSRQTMKMRTMVTLADATIRSRPSPASQITSPSAVSCVSGAWPSQPQFAISP